MSVERFDLQKDSFQKIADFFYVNGFVILDNALTSDEVDTIKNDLHMIDAECQTNKKKEIKKKMLKVNVMMFINVFLKILQPQLI